MLNNRNILLVGCGEMGSALMQGWLENGFEPTKICVVEPSEHHAEKIAPLGVKVIRITSYNVCYTKLLRT